MTNKLKIKLTKEQIDQIHTARGFLIDQKPTVILDIDESQIIKNDSVNKNEKTKVVISRYKIQEAIAELERANCSYYIFSVEEDQIFKEKSNAEKWAEVIQKWDDNGFDNKHDIATKLDQLGFSADTVHKEVCND